MATFTFVLTETSLEEVNKTERPCATCSLNQVKCDQSEMKETGRCARCLSIGVECPPWRKRSELKREALMKRKPSSAVISGEEGNENVEAATSGETEEEPSTENATRDDAEEGSHVETSSSTGGG